MVDGLVRCGALWSPACLQAFKAVDRRHFWLADSGDLAYADMPLRNGRLHISAPHIYGKALESLMPLKSGMSFLNVGSGTGYFNCIISELTGPMATNHGVDVVQDTVDHARSRCTILGKHHIEFTTGNVYQLDVELTTRYDRIYLGACANSRSKYLYRLLEVGGVLIGPFQVGHMQQLRRVVRQTETQFNVEVLGSVQFASLVEPAPTQTPPRDASSSSVPLTPPRPPRFLSDFVPPPRVVAPPTPAPPPPPPPPPAMAAPTPVLGAFNSRRRRHTTAGSGDAAGAGDGSQRRLAAHAKLCEGLPGVAFTFSLTERPWTPERCWLYPVSFRRVVAIGLMSRPADPSLPCLPAEIWTKHIFPLCPRWWFKTLADEETDMPQQHEDGSSCFQPPARRHCKGLGDFAGDSRSDDEDASTRAPSSTHTTPESVRPSEPSPEMEAIVNAIAEREAQLPSFGGSVGEDGEDGLDGGLGGDDEGPSEPGRRHTIGGSRALVEVFGNGQRHMIGAGGDPDDMEEEETPPQLAVSLRVLQLLTADAGRRRWPTSAADRGLQTVSRRLRRRTWQDLEREEDEMEDDENDEDNEDDETMLAENEEVGDDEDAIMAEARDDFEDTDVDDVDPAL